MKRTIPIFFAIDSNYVPFFTVSLTSIKENRDKAKDYTIYLLHTSLTKETKSKIIKLQEKKFNIVFINVSSKAKELSSKLAIRDYYTLSTYYRLFIADMFPEFDKALYLDSDTIINIDIAEIFKINLKKYFIAGVPDGAVKYNEIFSAYTKSVLGIDASKYFNAGVILMNLKEMREQHFLDKFLMLTSLYKFTVAQDQDYLNVLCFNKVKIIGEKWNTMPISKTDFQNQMPNIIHFNLTQKPWHYKGLKFEDYFWKYAQKTEYFDYLKNDILKNYSKEEKDSDNNCEKGLLALCQKETDDLNNYYTTYGRLFN